MAQSAFPRKSYTETLKHCWLNYVCVCVYLNLSLSEHVLSRQRFPCVVSAPLLHCCRCCGFWYCCIKNININNAATSQNRGDRTVGGLLHLERNTEFSDAFQGSKISMCFHNYTAINGKNYRNNVHLQWHTIMHEHAKFPA